ncbi:MAG TPA: dihydrofolate reductase family protein [Solirubrobacteraceae bacterium]|nr:dihydrofolate reductase family protein [Solirubrobacteraceae bacterium]
MLGEALTPLLATGDPVFAEDLVANLALRERATAGRPSVTAVMISSADGHATVDGRSTGLGHPADRALLRSLRAGVDAVLVGPGTIRAERYANLLDAGPRAARQASGWASLPTIATISRSGDVPWDVGLFEEPEARVVVFTDAVITPPPTAAQVMVVQRTALTEVLAHLHDRLGVRAVLCEGGPTLLRALAAADLIDTLFMTIAPLLTAGDGPAALSGSELDPPLRLALAAVYGAGDHAFLQYQRP